jgi:hypothetical protein
MCRCQGCDKVGSIEAVAGTNDNVPEPSFNKDESADARRKDNGTNSLTKAGHVYITRQPSVGTETKM